jgi:hypothetical protein
MKTIFAAILLSAALYEADGFVPQGKVLSLGSWSVRTSSPKPATIQFSTTEENAKTAEAIEEGLVPSALAMPPSNKFDLETALFCSGLAFDSYVEPPSNSSRWERGVREEHVGGFCYGTPFLTRDAVFSELFFSFYVHNN